MFVELHDGFELPNKVFHLQKSVYGLRQSPLDLYRYLREGLKNRGAMKLNHDDYVFTGGEIMVLFWVDDCIFYAKDTSLVNTIISNLKDESLLEQKEDMTRFFGLNIADDKNKGTVTLLQAGLIDKILLVSQMEECNITFTTTDKIPLDIDLDGDQCCEEWD